MPTLTAEYVKHRPMALHKLWFEYTPPMPVLSSSSSTSDADDNPQLQEQRQQPTTFASWLPGWFDAVLSLVVEERRQATTIFGAALVPEIVVQVSAQSLVRLPFRMLRLWTIERFFLFFLNNDYSVTQYMNQRSFVSVFVPFCLPSKVDWILSARRIRMSPRRDRSRIYLPFMNPCSNSYRYRTRPLSEDGWTWWNRRRAGVP